MWTVCPHLRSVSTHTLLSMTSVCVVAIVPGDFPAVLGVLTRQGYRVLAVAHRSLHMAWHRAERVSRYYTSTCIGHMTVDCYGNIHPSIPVLSPSFYIYMYMYVYIPSIYMYSLF